MRGNWKQVRRWAGNVWWWEQWEGVPAGQRGAGCEETGELAEGKKEQTTSLVVATLHSPAASWLVITPAPSPPSGSQLIRISCDVICHVQNKCQHLTYLWFAQTLLTYLGRFKRKNHVRVWKKKIMFCFKMQLEKSRCLVKETSASFATNMTSN